MAQRKKLPLVPERGIKLSREILNEHFHANLHFERTWTDAFADILTFEFGTISFLVLNAFFFVVWFIANLGLFWEPSFRPVPF